LKIACDKNGIELETLTKTKLCAAIHSEDRSIRDPLQSSSNKLVSLNYLHVECSF